MVSTRVDPDGMRAPDAVLQLTVLQSPRLGSCTVLELPTGPSMRKNTGQARRR
jgi:hypothetical protein